MAASKCERDHRGTRGVFGHEFAIGISVAIIFPELVQVNYIGRRNGRFENSMALAAYLRCQPQRFPVRAGRSRCSEPIRTELSQRGDRGRAIAMKTKLGLRGGGFANLNNEQRQ